MIFSPIGGYDLKLSMIYLLKHEWLFILVLVKTDLYFLFNPSGVG